MEFLSEIGSALGWVFSILIVIIGWFLRNVYSEHRDMYREHQKSIQTQTDIASLQVSVEKTNTKLNELKDEIRKVEEESKRYWVSHQIQMEANQKIIIEKISHMSETNKALLDAFSSQMEKLENRLENMNEKIDKKADKTSK